MNANTIMFKCLSIFIVLAMSMSGRFVASINAQPQRMGIPGPKEIRLPETDVVLEMNRLGRLPMIELMINDTGPYRMVVDTGAAGVVLQPELAKKLELPSPPGMPDDMTMQLKTPGGNVPGSLHYIDTLTIGAASFGGVWTVATVLPFGDDLEGVIGMNIFKECLLTYDYPENRFVLGKGELPEPNGKDVLAYATPRMPDSHPVIEIQVNGKTHAALIDSGFSNWFSIPQDNPEELQFLQGPVEAGMGKSVGKERTHNTAARLQATFEVGATKIDNPVVILGADYMIGTLFLENFSVTIDGRNKRIRLIRPLDEPLTQPAMRSLGFMLERTGNDMLVKYVHPQSNAAEHGLKVDDVVVEIDGKPVREVYYSDALRDLVQSAEKISIGFNPKGGNDTIRKLDIEIMELLK